MSKGEHTREIILQKAATLFNTKGYAAASISDIMGATGLQKGGIYNHFNSKDELTLEAFEYASKVVGQRFRESVKAQHNAIAKLEAIVGTFRMHSDNPPLVGGCVVLNAAIESDYSNPALRAKVREVMNDLRGLIRYVVDEGIKRRQIKPSVNSDYVATVIIATLEGGVMLAALYRDSQHLERVIHHVTEYIQTQLNA